MLFENAPIQNAYDALHRVAMQLLDKLESENERDAVRLVEDILRRETEVCITCGGAFPEYGGRWRGECGSCVKKLDPP